MATKYYIKLFHEVLDDPKMCRLVDRLYRRTIELFLIAGDFGGEDKSGSLPPIYDMAWRLRLTDEELERDLIELAKVGIVYQDGDRWTVTNFSKRQAPMEKGEYMHRLRQSRRRDVYDTDKLPNGGDSVTEVLPLVTQNRTEHNINRVEEEQKGAAASFPFEEYEQMQDSRTPNILSIYIQVTSQMDIPSRSKSEVIHDLGIVMDYYAAAGSEVDYKKGKQIFSKWCNTLGKNGRKYSKLNPGWVQWWIDELAPLPRSEITRSDLPAYLFEETPQ